jgi:hypothetical protein
LALQGLVQLGLKAKGDLAAQQFHLAGRFCLHGMALLL